MNMKSESMGSIKENMAAELNNNHSSAGPVVTVVKAHSGAVMLAHAMADGRDVHLEVQRDGSIIIKNGARK